MPIKDGDIYLLASRVMTDADNGGGGPSGVVIPYGRSNGIFRDITEAARAGGNVSIRQLHASVRTPNVDPLMGVNIILSKPPSDANVSITLTKCAMYATRTQIASAIANYLIEGPQWSGFLLENHVQGQRSLQIFHRPGTPAPNIGRTLVLMYTDGVADNRVQFVRVTRAETEVRTFTYTQGGDYVDFLGSVTELEISDPLRFAFPGSPPDRGFGAQVDKTILRDTTIADAATYYGAGLMTVAATIGASSVRVDSIYTQLVPSSRTETTALDQRPASVRTLVLADTPRRVEVSTAPHTRRIKIGQENRGFSFVDTLSPLPEPGSVVASFMVLGNWYQVMDDGAGGSIGDGVLVVNPLTGSISITTPEMPDPGSSVIIQWGERVGYTSRSGGAEFRLPEFEIALAHDQIEPGTLTVSWQSGGVTKAAADDGAGGLTGRAVGMVLYGPGRLRIRPLDMIDPGGQFNVTFRWVPAVTETISGATPDSAGFATMALVQQPTPGTVAVRWITSRTVSSTSGSTSGSNINKTPAYTAAGLSTLDTSTNSVNGGGAGNAGSNYITSVYQPIVNA